ncbi:uncharacterized protein [Callorhinus ursinus]|uniref:uncharacterized protein n=1 Tax=Callorhinus ursinus TaxID=34884 RepID=UPI003CD00147
MRSPFSHLSSFPWTSRRKNYPLHHLLVPYTHLRSPADPFPLLFFPSSEKSLVPEPVEPVLSPLPFPRESPLQPSPLPPPRFHSIDFCCMSTLIAGERRRRRKKERKKKEKEKVPPANSRLLLRGVKLPLPSPEPPFPPCSTPQTPALSAAQLQGMAFWTSDQDHLDPSIPREPRGPTLRRTRGAAVPPELAPKGSLASGLTELWLGHNRVLPPSTDQNSCFILKVFFVFFGFFLARQQGRREVARRAASHYPDDIFRRTRRSGSPEGNPRTSEDPFRVPALVFARPLGQHRNLILSCSRAPTSLPRPHPEAPG